MFIYTKNVINTQFMKLCNSCVMPETTETQLFDTKGTCSVCNQQNTKKIDWENRQIDLDKLIEQYRDKHFMIV